MLRISRGRSRKRKGISVLVDAIVGGLDGADEFLLLLENKVRSFTAYFAV